MALIHRWKLTTDANDSVGGLVTTNNGGVTFDAVNGASFNGSNQWLSFVKSLAVNNPMSISIWLKFANTTQTCRPFESSPSTSGNATGFYYAWGYAFGYYGDKNIGSADYTSINYPSSTFILCTMTYDGLNTLCLYRGDTLINTGIISEQTPQSIPDVNWSIGRHGSASIAYFNGNILDARIYNHALTATEVTSLASAGANGDTALKRRPRTI